MFILWWRECGIRLFVGVGRVGASGPEFHLGGREAPFSDTMRRLRCPLHCTHYVKGTCLVKADEFGGFWVVDDLLAQFKGDSKAN